MGVAAPQSPDAVDPTIYCEEDDVGEHEIQRYIVELLRPLVEDWVRTRGMEAHVGAGGRACGQGGRARGP